MKGDVKPSRERALRAVVVGRIDRKATTGRSRARRRMQEVELEIEATTTLNWDGGAIVVSVPADASRAEIEAAIVHHLMTNGQSMDWEWADPDIHDWEVVEDAGSV